MNFEAVLHVLVFEGRDNEDGAVRLLQGWGRAAVRWRCQSLALRCVQGAGCQEVPPTFRLDGAQLCLTMPVFDSVPGIALRAVLSGSVARPTISWWMLRAEGCEGEDH